MSDLITSLASPTGLILGLLIGLVWLFAAPASRGPRRWLAALSIVYLVVTVHGLARIVSWPLRLGFHSFALSDAPPAPLAIVLLGSGGRTVHGRTQKIGVLTLGG